MPPEPPDIKAIFDKPGKDWNVSEKRRVAEYLWEDPQRPFLLHIAQGILLDPALCEDAWSEFFIRRFHHLIEKYDPLERKRFFEWVAFAFRKFCFGLPKNIKKFDDVEIEEERSSRDETDPEDQMIHEEELARLWEGIQRLSPTLREVIILDLQGFTTKEIAEKLKITEENVRQRRTRALRWLREFLRDW